MSRIAPPALVLTDGGSGFATACTKVWPATRVQRVSEALCMRFNPQSRRRVRNNDCCVPEEA